jgi:hypothetical protein
MKTLAIAGALLVGISVLPAGQAQARGCISGALLGGTAGHFAGHHGLLGAAAGCVIGHHYANRHARMYRTTPQSGYGSSAAPQSGYNSSGYNSSGYNSSTMPQQVPAQRY